MPHAPATEKLYRTASFLALLTIIYNVAEGTVSAWFGIADETLSLFGFGLDSFVEVVSGVGIWHMVQRQRARDAVERDEFERQALYITGGGFYLLAAGLTLTAVYDIYGGHTPRTTIWGILISCISISFMWLLLHQKTKVGRALGSQAILADAACSRVCLYLSVVLLVASAGFELTGIGLLDAAGAFGIAWISLREGREALAKAKGMACRCGGCQ